MASCATPPPPAACSTPATPCSDYLQYNELHANLLQHDQLPVEFEEQQRSTCSSVRLIAGLLVCAALIIGLVFWLAHGNDSLVHNSSASANHGLPMLLVILALFCVVLLVGAMISQCNSCMASTTQKCIVTSTHIITSHGGFSRVEKKIPLQKVQSVTIRENGMLNTLSIDTGTYEIVTHGKRLVELKPDIVLCGVKNAVLVREFIFAKQQMLMLNQLRAAQNHVALQIAPVTDPAQLDAPTMEEMQELVVLRVKLARLEAEVASQRAYNAQHHATCYV